MKIASVISVSAVFVLTSLIAAVGCSAPEPANTKDKAAASAQEGGDEKTGGTSSSGGTTKPGTTTPGTTAPGTTTPAAEDNGEACLACVGATTKAGLEVKCEMACKDGDEACIDKCDADNCGADGAACKADFDKCAKQCAEGPAPTADQQAKYKACIAKSTNTKLKTYEACADKCTDDACDDKCWDDSKCDAACDTEIDKCDKEAGIGG